MASKEDLKRAGAWDEKHAEIAQKYLDLSIKYSELADKYVELKLKGVK